MELNKINIWYINFSSKIIETIQYIFKNISLYVHKRYFPSIDISSLESDSALLDRLEIYI